MIENLYVSVDLVQGRTSTAHPGSELRSGAQYQLLEDPSYMGSRCVLGDREFRRRPGGWSVLRATRSATSCCGRRASGWFVVWRLLLGSSEERGSIPLLFFREGILDGPIQGHGSPLLRLLLPGGLLQAGCEPLLCEAHHRALLWYPRDAAASRYSAAAPPQPRRTTDLLPRSGDAPNDVKGEINPQVPQPAPVILHGLHAERLSTVHYCSEIAPLKFRRGQINKELTCSCL